MMVFHLPPRTVSANSVGQLKLVASGLFIGCSRARYGVQHGSPCGSVILTDRKETQVKVQAILTLMPQTPLETVRGELADELRGSWALYASGVLREIYATDDPKKVVFVLEAADAQAARQALAPLPMIAAGMFGMEIVELRPFVNWSMLFAK
jgi:hypothetical protein